MKRVFLFPGQGSQAVGMGKDLIESYPEARAIFETADSTLGLPISKWCFEGPEEELKKTANTQPALLTVSVALGAILKSRGYSFEAVAGHSLGAYSALTVAGVIAFPEALRLVRRRGELMEQVGAGRGTMAAVLGLSEEKIREACQSVAAQGVVEPANVNCPGQVVISGEKAAVAAACEACKALGAKRAIELAVSGPFHCSLMKPAAELFRPVLAETKFSAPQVTFFSDIDAVPLTDPEVIRESLVRQLLNPVQWIRVVEGLAAAGYGEFVEVGPGRVLGGLVGKIRKDLAVRSIGTAESIAQWSRG